MTPKQMLMLALIFLLCMGAVSALVILIPAFILVAVCAGATLVAYVRKRNQPEEIEYEYYYPR